MIAGDFCLKETPHLGVGSILDCHCQNFHLCRRNGSRIFQPNYFILHRKEIRNLRFRALTLHRSESRNCGLCVVYIQKCGATLLVGAWQREKKTE